MQTTAPPSQQAVSWGRGACETKGLEPPAVPLAVQMLPRARLLHAAALARADRAVPVCFIGVPLRRKMCGLAQVPHVAILTEGLQNTT